MREPQAIVQLEQAAVRARNAVLAAISHAEHSPPAQAVEEYARARALLFGRTLVQQLEERLLAAPPTTAAELVAVLEATLAAAALTCGVLGPAQAISSGAAAGTAAPPAVAAGIRPVRHGSEVLP